MPMHKMGFFLLSLGLISLLAVGSVGWAIDNADLQKKIEQTKKKLSQTKKREGSVLNSLLQTQQELEKINDNLEKLNSSIDKTEHRMDIIETQLDNTQFELEKIKIAIGGRKGVLDQRLVAIYKYGYQSCLEVLFTAKNYAEFVSRFEMVSDFVKGDLHILKTLRQQQIIIAQKKEEIAKRQQELQEQKRIYARLQVQNEVAQSRQMKLIRNKKEELTALQKDRRVLEKSLDELEKTSKEMEAQIRNLQNKNRPALGSGKYIWPTPGRITSYFGYRIHPILHKRKYHSGIDIAAPLGTAIVAADAGSVIFSGRNGGYGKMVIIDHGNAISTVYAHCSVIITEDNRTVAKGEIIAKVGSTGFSTGPHLHFEIRKNGVPVDPLNSL